MQQSLGISIGAENLVAAACRLSDNAVVACTTPALAFLTPRTVLPFCPLLKILIILLNYFQDKFNH
jgi:hypothetical protein